MQQFNKVPLRTTLGTAGKLSAIPVLSLFLIAIPVTPEAGTYTDSAHGTASLGVYRSNIGDAPPNGFGYSRGNCAHCHEQHSSIAGSEPAPVTGTVGFMLFARNFNTARQANPYSEEDNFCFYCHNASGSAQQVSNYDYSRIFGCGPAVGPTSVMAAMNQLSYHNLYDINRFSRDTFNWYKDSSNPCNGCHNPHLARRNWASPRDSSFSAISKPTDHFNLWGTTETMATSYNTNYEPPFCSNALSDREPAASADDSSGRASTPDYVAFCTDCHNTSNSISSTTLGKTVTSIDWSPIGDKHGLAGDSPGDTIKAPYLSTGTYVLSCVDCHEPHGAQNLMLLRTRVNGGELGGIIADADSTQWSNLCKRCHMDDKDAVEADLPFSWQVSGDENSWRYVHHSAADAPFGGPLGRCSGCHDHGPPGPISCGTADLSYTCHSHGKVF